MTDLPEELFESVVAAIDERSDVYEGYIRILDAQRVAVRAGDLSLITSLAARVDEIIEQLQKNWQAIAPVESYLHNAANNGVRTQTVRDRLTIISAKAALAQAGIRDLTARLCAQRDAVSQLMEADFGMSPMARDQYGLSQSPFNSTSLIDASG